METKPLLYGLIGFFLGGLLVSIAATTFNKPSEKTSDVSMSQMTEVLKNKQGDEFDKAFIAAMIEYHDDVANIAKLSDTNAKHDEIKQLSQKLIAANKAEVAAMQQWQKDWGYEKDMVQKEREVE